MHYYSAGHHTPIYEHCGYSKEQWRELSKKERRIAVLIYVGKIAAFIVCSLAFLALLMLLCMAPECEEHNKHRVYSQPQQRSAQDSRNMAANSHSGTVYDDGQELLAKIPKSPVDDLPRNEQCLSTSGLSAYL